MGQDFYFAASGFVLFTRAAVGRDDRRLTRQARRRGLRIRGFKAIAEVSSGLS